MSPQHRAEFALLGVTLIWGLTFPLIGDTVKQIAALEFVMTRFGMAAILLLPVALWRRREILQHWGWGLLLGFLAWASYLSQTIGLQTVKAGPAAFITASSVVMVPLLSPLFRAGHPRAIDLAAAAVATGGLYLLCDSGERSLADSGALSPGVLWILLCAFTYALYIHFLQLRMKRGQEQVVVVIQQVFVVAALSLAGWSLVPVAAAALPIDPASAPHWTPRALASVLFCAVFATVISFWLQARYQPRTTPERTALIFTMEPVFAAVFAWLLLSETLTNRALTGTALILAAILGAEYFALKLRRRASVLQRTRRPHGSNQEPFM